VFVIHVMSCFPQYCTDSMYCLATMLARGVIPTVETILCDEEHFLTTGILTSKLYWFKTKMMRAINNNSWDPFRHSPKDYYIKCGIVDEAMGLWILHFKDHINVAIESEIMNVNESNAQEEDKDGKNQMNFKKRKGESHIQKLHGYVSMSINMYTFYKEKLESLCAGDGVIPLVSLSDIIAMKVINNRNTQQLRPLTVDDDSSSEEDDEDDGEESIPVHAEDMDHNTWDSV